MMLTVCMLDFTVLPMLGHDCFSVNNNRRVSMIRDCDNHKHPSEHKDAIGTIGDAPKVNHLSYFNKYKGVCPRS